jgi:translation initiation factor 5
MALNIGRNQDDASFRYKMPRMQSKIEGRGNGIKTVILNMSEVARALNVDGDYPTKFFGTELGSQSKYDPKEDRAVVNGAHDGLKLAELLNKFIELFILCPKCKYATLNPLFLFRLFLSSLVCYLGLVILCPCTH